MFQSIIQLQQGNRALYNENPLVRWRDIVLLAILYFVTARIGQLFAIPPGNVTPVWIPSGIIVAAILYRGYEIWPGIFIGAFTGNIWAYFTSDNTLALANSVFAGFFNGVGDTLGAIIGVYFILLKCKTPYPFNRTIHLLYFVLFGALLSSSISAGFGVTALWANGFISDIQFNNVLVTWFTGDAVGTVILAPLILSLVNSQKNMGGSREKFVYFLLLVLISIFALGVLADTPKSTFLFLLLPFTLWAILRFDQQTVFGTILLISVLSISTLLLNIGWFSTLDENSQLTELQQFVFIFAISVMLLSTLQKERSNAENKLKEINQTLDKKVDLRTAELEEKNLKLNESESFLSAALNSSQTGIYIYDIVSGKNRYINRQYTKITGYTFDDIQGFSSKDFLKLFHPDDLVAVQNHMENVLSGEISQTQEIEYRFKNKKGKWRWLYSQDSLFKKDKQGKPIQFIGSFVDITKRKKNEEQLYQAAAVFASTAEGIAITDANANILDVNQSFCDITGYSKEEVIGENPRLLQSGKHNKKFYQKMWQSLLDVGFWKGELWNRSKGGSIYPALMSINAIKDSENSTTGYVAAFSDITAMKQSEGRLDYLAHHDVLTNLPNRLLFNERLSQSLKRAKRYNSSLAVLFLDLDRFKNVNDSLGHQHGDELLKQVSERLTQSIRQEDTLSRISGDEFIILLEGMSSVENTTTVVDKIMSAFDEPFSVIGTEIRMSCSIGISIFPNDGDDVPALLRNADAAMYRAKEDGRNSYQFYTKEMTRAAFENVFFETALKNAILNDEFFLVFQPQYRLEDSKLIGMEALIRWQNPDLGLISPSRFIPIAEQNGQIRGIGDWVLLKVFEQGRKWIDEGYNFGRIAINISGQQLQQESFLKNFKKLLKQTGMPANCIEIEVTETFFMKSTEHAVDTLRALRDLGAQISIDDFGTGYSSLAYLKKFPVTSLKIDQSFVRDAPSNIDDVEISKAIIAMATALNLEVIAEGIESKGQLEILKNINCTYGQGFLFSTPLKTDEITSLLAR